MPINARLGRSEGLLPVSVGGKAYSPTGGSRPFSDGKPNESSKLAEADIPADALVDASLAPSFLGG